jgi:hypothetical protein
MMHWAQLLIPIQPLVNDYANRTWKIFKLAEQLLQSVSGQFNPAFRLPNIV